MSCSICGKSFIYIGNLRLHERTHKGIHIYKCKNQDCEKSFKSLKGYKHHTLLHDKEKIPYICKYPECKKGYFSESRILSHYRFHVIYFLMFRKEELRIILVYYAENNSTKKQI
jgi:KRAB domain-containing zinc finger protein